MGDYVNNKKHFVDLSRYYDRILIDITQENPTIHIISDGNITQIYEVYPIVKKHAKYFVHLNTVPGNALLDLYIMRQCKLGCICANSTFSWWGAYLNQSITKKIYMPSKWINMDLHNNTLDIHIKGAIKIDV